MNQDSELQNSIEKGEPAETAQAMAYQKIFEILKQPNGVSLSQEFSENVVTEVRRRARIKTFLEEYGLAIFCAFVIVAACVYTISITDIVLDLGFLNAMSSYGGVLIFGAILILLFNVFDRKLLARRSQRSNGL